MSNHLFEFDPARALPAAAYRNDAWLTAEKERIWHGSWVFVTTEASLPEPGDQLAVKVGDQPVLLLRNQAGELVALSNLCAHRGTQLVEGRTNGKRIQCPYHAWTYDDAGCLIGVPFEQHNGVDRQSHRLPAYRVESWHGLIFVSLNQNVEPLTQLFSAIEPHLVARHVDQMLHRPEYEETEVWECNWKIAITNAMESYHLFKVHPKSLEPYSPTRDAYYVVGSAHATATGGSYKAGGGYLLISLPPNFVGIFTQDSLLWIAVHPNGTHRCDIHLGAAFMESEDAGAFQRLSEWTSLMVDAAVTQDFLPEDKAICERIQRGMTGDFEPGQLLPIERVVSDFGHYLNWRMNGVEPPAVFSEQA